MRNHANQTYPHHCTNDVFILDDDRAIIIIVSEGVAYEVICLRFEFDRLDGLIQGVSWVFNNGYVNIMGSPIREPSTGEPGHKIGGMRAFHILQQQDLYNRGLLEPGGPRWDHGTVFKLGPFGRLDLRPQNRLPVPSDAAGPNGPAHTTDKACQIIFYYQDRLRHGATSEEVTRELEELWRETGADN